MLKHLKLTTERAAAAAPLERGVAIYSMGGRNLTDCSDTRKEVKW